MPVDIIAEIGSSHKGELNRALGLIEYAAHAGANTVKFQLFRADTLWRANHPAHTEAAHYEVEESWLLPLQQTAQACGMEFLCTPFDLWAVGVLEKLGVKRYKIASGDLTYSPLLEVVAQTHKPVLVSTGYATQDEIGVAIETLSAGGTPHITLMHCVGGYPTLPNESKLKRLERLIEQFGMSLRPMGFGLSAHWQEWWLTAACVPYGLESIEHHLDTILSDGPEAKHSLSVQEFAKMVRAVRDVEAGLASGEDWSEKETTERKIARRDPSDWLRPPLKTV